jgi:hypothetical protein
MVVSGLRVAKDNQHSCRVFMGRSCITNGVQAGTVLQVLQTVELRRACLQGFSVLLAEVDAGYTQLLVNRTAMK